MYLSVELDPVAAPKPARRLRHFLRLVGLSAIVLLGMGIVIVPLLHFLTIDPKRAGWGQLCSMYALMAGLVFFVPMLFIAQDLRFKRWRQAAEERYGNARTEAWGWWWRIFGAEQRGGVWVIDCGTGRLLRRITVPDNDLMFSPLDQPDRAQLRFGEVKLELPRYDSQPIRLRMGGPVIVDCFPEELPPLREGYVSSLP